MLGRSSLLGLRAERLSMGAAGLRPTGCTSTASTKGLDRCLPGMLCVCRSTSDEGCWVKQYAAPKHHYLPILKGFIFYRQVSFSVETSGTLCESQPQGHLIDEKRAALV